MIKMLIVTMVAIVIVKMIVNVIVMETSRCAASSVPAESAVN